METNYATDEQKFNNLTDSLKVLLLSTTKRFDVALGKPFKVYLFSKVRILIVSSSKYNFFIIESFDLSMVQESSASF